MNHGVTLDTTRRTRRRFGVVALLGAAMFAAHAPAQPKGDDASFVQKVNDIFKGRDRAVPDERRADLKLFPTLAAMTAPPGVISTPLRAALLTSESDGWSEAEQWALGEPQRAALDAVREVGDPAKRFAFLHGYGREAAPPEWVDAGLYVDLGEPPILAAANFRYFDGLVRLATLVNIEATRLIHEDKAKDGAELLVRWVFIGRLLADREFFTEKRVADLIMRTGLERLRDVAFTHADAFTDSELRDVIAMLDARQLLLDRLMFPRADRIAAEQVLARAFTATGGAHAETFGPTMARISSSGRPLTMFGESSRWQASAAGLAGTYDTFDELETVYNDWLYRWDLAYFDDIVVKRPSDYDLMDKVKFAVIDRLVGQTRTMFAMRQRLDSDFAATRLALGVAAFHRRYNLFPETLAAIRPGYVSRIETDPYSRTGEDFHYFVPMRGQRVGPRESPTPHAIRVSVPGDAAQDENAAHNAEVDRIVGETMAALSEFIGELNTLIAEGSRQAQRRFTEILTKYEARMVKIGESINKETHARLDELFRERGREIVRQRMTDLERRIAGSAPISEQEITSSIGQAFRNSMRIESGGFERNLDDSTFVLYSIGPTGERNWARSVGEGGEDLLYWPPLLSLVRDEFAKTGDQPVDRIGAWFDYAPALRFEVGTARKDGESDETEQTDVQVVDPDSTRQPRIPF